VGGVKEMMIRMSRVLCHCGDYLYREVKAHALSSLTLGVGKMTCVLQKSFCLSLCLSIFQSDLYYLKSLIDAAFDRSRTARCERVDHVMVDSSIWLVHDYHELHQPGNVFSIHASNLQVMMYYI
jgi:hypothetical protein